MATFSGGEEITNVLHIAVTGTASINYTPPAGKYSEIWGYGSHGGTGSTQVLIGCEFCFGLQNNDSGSLWQTRTNSTPIGAIERIVLNEGRTLSIASNGNAFNREITIKEYNKP